MRIQFAPLRIPLERRLQTLGVFQWIFSFLGLAQCCLVAFVLLLFTDYWLAAVLYAGWLYLDRETPSSGGRRSAWVRNWVIWRCFSEYFPITLVKTAELDPKYNYLFGFHPHGILVAGAFGNFCTEATGFSRLFPGLTSYLLMLPFWFRVPFYREYIMCGGLVSSDKQSANHILSQPGGGQVAVLAVGGPPESLDARPGALTLSLLARKGFIKMALKTGAQLVPVFSFGENELFNQVENPPGSALRVVQERLQKMMGLAMPLFHARGIFQYSFGLIPFRKPIYTVATCRKDINETERVQMLSGLEDLSEKERLNSGQTHSSGAEPQPLPQRHRETPQAVPGSPHPPVRGTQDPVWHRRGQPLGVYIAEATPSRDVISNR